MKDIKVGDRVRRTYVAPGSPDEFVTVTRLGLHPFCKVPGVWYLIDGWEVWDGPEYFEKPIPVGVPDDAKPVCCGAMAGGGTR